MELRKVQENQERLATLLDNQTVETDVPALEQMMSIKDFDLQELLQSKEKRAEKVIFFFCKFFVIYCCITHWGEERKSKCSLGFGRSFSQRGPAFVFKRRNQRQKGVRKNEPLKMFSR